MTSQLLLRFSPQQLLLLLILLIGTALSSVGALDDSLMTKEEIHRKMQNDMDELMQYLARDVDDESPFKFSWNDDEEEHPIEQNNKRMLRDPSPAKEAEEEKEDLDGGEDDEEEDDEELEDLRQRQLSSDSVDQYRIYQIDFKFSGSRGFNIQNMNAKEKVKFVPCLYEAGETYHSCGRDRCVSIRPANDDGKYVRVKEEDGKTLRLENLGRITNLKDASFCLRPGLKSSTTLSLESVAYPGSYAVLDESIGRWVVAPKEDSDIDDKDGELSSFRMEKVGGGKICKTVSHCGPNTDEWKCSGGRCYPKKNVGDLCSSPGECKSGKCVLGLLGNFLAGQWTKMCGYDPNVPVPTTTN